MGNHYIHNLDPIALNIGDFLVPWYWLVYLLGFFFIYVSGPNLIKRVGARPISAVDWSDFLSFGWLGLIVGARLGYFLLYQTEMLEKDPWILIRIWAGGMSFHGAVLGACLAIAAVAYFKKTSPWPIFDVICTLLPVCIVFGRLANFVNGELAGRPSTVPWAVVFPGFYDSLPRHPSQIYEALGEGLLVGIILWRGRLSLRIPSRQTGVFLIGYSFARFGLEFFMEPDPQLGLIVLNLSMGQLLSIIFFVLGLGILKKSSSTILPGLPETTKVL